MSLLILIIAAGSSYRYPRTSRYRSHSYSDHFCHDRIACTPYEQLLPKIVSSLGKKRAGVMTMLVLQDFFDH
jgi:hypothetical protein